jgi:mannose-6-phosphate isomerase-like protein (cupin superfamily)
VLREGPIPEDAYPRAGSVYSSEVEGVESHIIRNENMHDLKRVWVRPGAVGPPEHLHLDLTEQFNVLEGELVVVLNGAERVAHAGESVVISPHTAHRFFNRSNSPALYEMTVPREHDLFTSQLYGFTNEHGSFAAHPAEALLQMSRFRPDAWRTSPPIEVQRTMYFLVEPTARLLGYERYYPQYVPRVVDADFSK